ncbi:MAG: DnaB-like helicase N-terminal domain-containing protein [Alphaproteobacteria bacterium]
MGQIADPVTLKNFFETDGNLDQIGGTQYLARLAASVATLATAGDYGRTIYDRFLRRQLIAIAEDTADRAYDYDISVNATNQIELAEQASLPELATSGQYGQGFRASSRACSRTLCRSPRPPTSAKAGRRGSRPASRASTPSWAVSAARS